MKITTLSEVYLLSKGRYDQIHIGYRAKRLRHIGTAGQKWHRDYGYKVTEPSNESFYTRLEWKEDRIYFVGKYPTSFPDSNLCRVYELYFDFFPFFSLLI